MSEYTMQILAVWGVMNNHIINFILTERLGQQGEDDPGHELDLLHRHFCRHHGRGVRRR